MTLDSATLYALAEVRRRKAALAVPGSQFQSTSALMATVYEEMAADVQRLEDAEGGPDSRG